MAQRNSDEQDTFERVLKLVEGLSPEAQERLVEQMKLHWLRKAVDQADESVAQGKVRPAEEVFAELEEKYRPRKAEK